MWPAQKKKVRSERSMYAVETRGKIGHPKHLSLPAKISYNRPFVLASVLIFCSYVQMQKAVLVFLTLHKYRLFQFLAEAVAQMIWSKIMKGITIKDAGLSVAHNEQPKESHRGTAFNLQKWNTLQAVLCFQVCLYNVWFATKFVLEHWVNPFGQPVVELDSRVKSRATGGGAEGCV